VYCQYAARVDVEVDTNKYGKEHMANTRHPDRKRLQLWLMERDLDVLKKVADKEGLSMPELQEVMTMLLEEKLKKEKAGFKKLKDKVKYKQR